jgi:subtilase family serine protease
MLSCFAIRRLEVLCALLMGFVVSLTVPVLSAQMRSGAISELKLVKQADRIAANPDYGPMTSLSGRLPGWARAGNQISGQSIDLGASVHVAVVLSREAAAQAAFEQLLTDQQNPGSPLYHQWLTPQQVGQLFGPTAKDLSAVTSWLTSQGLKVESIAPSGVIVEASGTLAVVGDAFHTSFGMFGLRGRQRIAAVSEPLIPAALSPLIRSVQGLTETHYEPQSTFSVHTLPAAGPRPQTDLGSGSYGILPGDFGVIYDIASVYSGGNEGATLGSNAQRVAVIGKSRVVAADISNYESLAGLPSVQARVVLAGADPGIAAGTNVGYASEATLDVDRVVGTAPGAQVDLVISADSTTDDGVDIAMAYNINTLLDPVMTVSFGSCEADNGAAETDFLNSEFEVAAGEGISTFVSAGDSGVAGCDTAFASAPTTPQSASINALCSSSYVTCVGGTEFNDVADPSLYWSATNSNGGYESALSYITEGAWNESETLNSSGQTVYQVAAGGGGVSAYIPKPSWQIGAGVPADGFRDVPDVSLTSADHDGYIGCFAAGGGSCVTTNAGTKITMFSGTSAAAPGMAGIAALLNTKLGGAQGNLNPMLYGLAASDPAAFHDVTVASSGVGGCTSATPSICNNSDPGASSLTGGVAGYVVGAGYDQVTGLGSVDVARLLAAATSGAGDGTGSFTLAANPSTLSVTPVANTTTTSVWTLTATSVNGFAGTVGLSCAVTPASSQPPTCSVTPGSVSLAAGGAETATIAITSAGPTSNCLTAAARTGWLGGSGYGSGGAALAGLLLLVLPVRKRRGLRGLALVCLLAAGLGTMSGCSGSATTTACSNVVSAGTTAGTYTVTVTGISGTLTATAPVALTVTVN